VSTLDPVSDQWSLLAYARSLATGPPQLLFVGGTGTPVGSDWVLVSRSTIAGPWGAEFTALVLLEGESGARVWEWAGSIHNFSIAVDPTERYALVMWEDYAREQSGLLLLDTRNRRARAVTQPDDGYTYRPLGWTVAGVAFVRQQGELPRVRPRWDLVCADGLDLERQAIIRVTAHLLRGVTPGPDQRTPAAPASEARQ